MRLLWNNTQRAFRIHSRLIKMNVSARHKLKQYLEIGEQELYGVQLRLDVGKKDVAKIEAVYQDTMPQGSKIGVLIMLHGSPGSHNDFKYITQNLRCSGIRVIGVNYPGMGYSSYDERLSNNNDERTRYVQQLIYQLGIDKNVVFMGHSRGSENALRMAANNTHKTIAAILVNPIGFRKHKGVRPWWQLEMGAWFWANMKPLRHMILAPLFHLTYKLLGFRVNSGYIAALAIQQMRSTDFEMQKQFVDVINRTSHVRILLLYSGKDNLVEVENSAELVESFEDCEKLTCETQGEEVENDSIVDDVRRKLSIEYPKNLSIYFSNEDHFLQKHRAYLLSEAVKTLLKHTKDEANNNNSKI